jgi:hypothetical protein
MVWWSDSLNGLPKWHSWSHQLSSTVTMLYSKAPTVLACLPFTTLLFASPGRCHNTTNTARLWANSHVGAKALLKLTIRSIGWRSDVPSSSPDISWLWEINWPAVCWRALNMCQLQEATKIMRMEHSYLEWPNTLETVTTLLTIQVSRSEALEAVEYFTPCKPVEHKLLSEMFEIQMY